MVGLINFIIFVYAIGVFGAAVSGGSLYARYKPSELNKTPLLILISLIPVLNYCLMWEGFKSYHSYATMNETDYGFRFRKDTSMRTHRKGISNG